jgi:hypothetical protein
MSRSTRLFTIVIALAVLSNPARAGWQWTDWGMTRAQIEKAALARGISLTEASNSHPEQVELNTPYSTLGLQFLARLIFYQRGTLMQVVLQQRDGTQCPALAETMKSSYGVPYDMHDGAGLHTWSWRDERRGNDVMFRLVGPSDYPQRWCDIQYSRLADAHKLGL